MHDRGRILIVDDDHEIRFGTSMRLRAAHFEPSFASDGAQGIEAARETHPDAILLDVKMPNMDGLAALHELKRCADTKNIPVVMLSASLRDRKAALDAGARFFMTKPYESRELLMALDKALTEAKNVRE